MMLNLRRSSGRFATWLTHAESITLNSKGFSHIAEAERGT